MSASDNLSNQQFMHIDDVANLPTRDFESLPLKYLGRDFFIERGEDPSHYDNLKASIAKEGMRKPIQVHEETKDEGPWLYDGHHRATIAMELGMKKVPVKYINTGGKPY